MGRSRYPAIGRRLPIDDNARFPVVAIHDDAVAVVFFLDVKVGMMMNPGEQFFPGSRVQSR